MLGASIVGFILFVLLTIYYWVAASGHPRPKTHAPVRRAQPFSAASIVGWFSLPEGMMQRKN